MQREWGPAARKRHAAQLDAHVQLREANIMLDNDRLPAFMRTGYEAQARAARRLIAFLAAREVIATRRLPTTVAARRVARRTRRPASTRAAHRPVAQVPEPASHGSLPRAGDRQSGDDPPPRRHDRGVLA